MLYSPNEVYRLPARVGYEIDLEFQKGEVFVGLGAGDSEGLIFRAAANHLFIKPKASNVHTNVTVLTDRRIYRFDYMTLAPDTTVDQIDTVYALRFLYAEMPTSVPPAAPPVASSSATVERLLRESPSSRERNSNYWYCGASQIRPVTAWDDGVHTHLQFAANAELPAIFVMNEDGGESLIDFNMVDEELVVHRIARRFLLRRGKLLGCILNRGFIGSGDSLPSRTISSGVVRKLRETNNEAGP